MERTVGQIADPLGTFYRFNLAHSILRRVQNDIKNVGGGASK